MKLIFPVIHCDLFLTNLIHAIVYAKRILTVGHRHALSNTKKHGSWGTRGALVDRSSMKHEIKQNKPH